MEHVAEHVGYAQLIGKEVDPVLMEKLNSRLSNCQMRALTACKYDNDGEFSVYLEGVTKGSEYTPFTLGITGTPDTIGCGMMSITKRFFKTITTIDDRKVLEDFFRTEIIPQFC